MRIDNLDLNNVTWFGEEGATFYRARGIIALLQTKFSKFQVMSPNYNVNWSARSYYLTPLNILLWDYVMKICYSLNRVYVSKLWKICMIVGSIID